MTNKGKETVINRVSKWLRDKFEKTRREGIENRERKENIKRAKMMVKGIEEEVKMTLPEELQEDITWVQVTKALVNAEKIWDYHEFESTEYLMYGKNLQVIKYERERLFITEHLIGGNYRKLMLEEKVQNRQKALLFIVELTKSPLLERLSSLVQLETEGDLKAFANRNSEDIMEFFQPIHDFLTYAKHERFKLERESKELTEKRLEEMKSKEQVKADAVFQYGFMRLDEMQEVEIPKLKGQLKNN